MSDTFVPPLHVIHEARGMLRLATQLEPEHLIEDMWIDAHECDINIHKWDECNGIECAIYPTFTDDKGYRQTNTNQWHKVTL